MSELLVDFITSLDGYASGEGWPGFWGLEGPEYLAWLGEQPEAITLDVRDGNEVLYVAAARRGILASRDGGRTFTTRYAE